MTCVAIIVWASEYRGELKSLPACARDAEAMKAIISNEPRFNDVLHIENESSSVVAFETISKFLKKFGNSDIDEVFFYFTGHGEAVEDDFLFLMPGYKSSSKMSTSIVNSQLDDLVRSLNPKLFVKIVDACESGTAYIKDTGQYDIFSKSKSAFQNVFFFSSSHSDERSYLDSHLSYLTECIVKTVYDHPIDSVRYVNLLNSAADFFAILDFQRPYVVQQGSLDSIFCTVDTAAKSKLTPFIRLSSTSETAAKHPVKVSIVDLVARDAERHADKEQTQAKLRFISSSFDDFDLSDDLVG